MTWSMGLLGGAGNIVGPVYGFDHLSTTELSSATSTVVLSNLNTTYSDYQDLQVRFVGRDNRGDYSSQLNVQVNGITSNSYWAHGFTGYSTNLAPFSYGSAISRWTLDIMTGGNANANAFGGGIIDFFDAFDSSKAINMRFRGGMKQTTGFNPYVGGGGTVTGGGQALTSLTFYGIGTMQQYTRISLYGRKVA